MQIPYMYKNMSSHMLRIICARLLARQSMLTHGRILHLTRQTASLQSGVNVVPRVIHGQTTAVDAVSHTYI